MIILGCPFRLDCEIELPIVKIWIEIAPNGSIVLYCIENPPSTEIYSFKTANQDSDFNYGLQSIVSIASIITTKLIKIFRDKLRKPLKGI